MIKIVVFCLIFLSTAARAQSVAVSVFPDDCERLARGADYVAGVSTTGARVVPADLDAVPAVVPDMRETVVYLDLKKDFPFWSSDARFGVYPVARVEFKKDGVFVNGTRVLEHGLNALKNACLRKAEQ